jgi:hypothetical protein
LLRWRDDLSDESSECRDDFFFFLEDFSEDFFLFVDFSDELSGFFGDLFEIFSTDSFCCDAGRRIQLSSIVNGGRIT